MKDRNEDSKLDNQLATGEKVQTGKSKIRLKFTDYAIERFMPSFMIEGKLREIVDTPFDVSYEKLVENQENY